MSAYSEKLKDPRWQAKREIILIRDEEKCRHCVSRERLEVHHCYYIPGADPWEYDDSALVTLCRPCHKRVGEMMRVVGMRMGWNDLQCRALYALCTHLEPTNEHSKKSPAIYGVYRAIDDLLRYVARLGVVDPDDGFVNQTHALDALSMEEERILRALISLREIATAKLPSRI